MAQRRMFSPKIVDSDAFLDMPQSSQLLYFHLSMRADDDGFVGNPKKVLRMIWGNDDDLKVLIAKRFILTFQSGVIVIKHWKIHNLIRSDRYNETQYLEEKRQLDIKENGSYTELNANVIPNDNQLAPQVRLGKVRLGKVITPAVAGEVYSKEFTTFWEKYPKKIGKGAACVAWKKVKHPSLEVVLAALEVQINSAAWKRDDGQYIPHPTTWLNQSRWDDEVQKESLAYKVTKI